LRIITTLAGIVSFYVFDHYFDINFQIKHYIYILALTFFGVLLSPLYYLSLNYDKILHLAMPIVVSGIFFFIIDKQKISFKWKLLVTFGFTLSSLVIFEIVEFVLDTLWDFKFQGVYVRDLTGLEKFNIVMDRNDDTMIDLILGFCGTLVFIFWKTLENLRKFKREEK